MLQTGISGLPIVHWLSMYMVMWKLSPSLQQSGGPLECFMLTPSFEKSGGGPSECFNLAPSLEQSGGPSSIHL